MPNPPAIDRDDKAVLEESLANLKPLHDIAEYEIEIYDSYSNYKITKKYYNEILTIKQTRDCDDYLEKIYEANTFEDAYVQEYNDEGNALEKMIPGSVQVSGSTTDEDKERAYNGFSDGSVRVLIIKPKIGAWGLNWQHCNHVVTFASHSYEQYYQAIRRCWRFGQKRPVTVDIIASEGETRVKENMARKAAQADKLFAELVRHMNNAISQERKIHHVKPELPAWL